MNHEVSVRDLRYCNRGTGIWGNTERRSAGRAASAHGVIRGSDQSPQAALLLKLSKVTEIYQFTFPNKLQSSFEPF